MILLLALLNPASAQTFTRAAVPDLNAQYFRPSVDATRTFWTDESSLPEQFIAPKLLLHYTDEPLVYTFDNGLDVPLVNGVAQADVMMSATVDRFRVGLDVPIYLSAEGALAGGEFGLGDIALDGKAMLLPEADGPVGVAVGGRLYLPTATVENALGAPNVGWELSAIVDKRFLDDRALVAANVGYRGGPAQDLENVALNDYLSWRAGSAYDVASWVAFSAELVGGYSLSGAGVAAAVPVEGMLGAHLLTDDVALRLGSGVGLTGGIGAPDWRVIVGIDYIRGLEDEPDTDGDGLVDSVDTCPLDPEDRDGVLDDDGCVDPPTPVTVHVVDPTGAPIPTAQVALHQQELAAGSGPTGTVFTLEPGAFDAAASAEGYRAGSASFSVAPVEGEKVVTIELVPVSGGLKLAAVTAEGAPVDVEFFFAGASIGAGSLYEGAQPVGEAAVVARAKGYKAGRATVVVVDDQVVEATLVMVPSRADLIGDRIDLRDVVNFDTAKATIQPRSFSLLDDVVFILGEHPELTKLRIEGHTDSRGSDASNKTLSQARAEAVQAYLVSKGIDPGRLLAVGYGEEKPVDPREVPEAWEKNRRVDFFVAERSD